jgi:hypothetical protein
MVTGGTDREHQALQGFDVLEWRVKCRQVCICGELSAFVCGKSLAFA